MMEKTDLLVALIPLSVRLQRSLASVIVIILVILSTIVALAGLVVDTITQRQVLLLVGVNLILMAGYFRALDPKRDEIHPAITSVSALVGATIIALTFREVADHPYVTVTELAAIGIFALMVPTLWFWYVILYLGSYDDEIEYAADIIGGQAGETIKSIANTIGMSNTNRAREGDGDADGEE